MTERKARMIRVVENLGGTGGKIGPAMRAAGYSAKAADNPQRLTKSKTWMETLEEHLPDSLLIDHHTRLLTAHRLEHMTFPPLPAPKKIKKTKKNKKPVDEDLDDAEELEDEEGDDDKENILGAVAAVKAAMNGEDAGAKLSDNDIRDMLKEVGCTVRKIVHSLMARHVYFWSPDNKAKEKALEMAYKLKSRFVDKVENVHTFTGYEELTDEEIANEFANISKSIPRGVQAPSQGTTKQDNVSPQGA